MTAQTPPKPRPSLMEAVSSGSVEAVKALLLVGADVNERDSEDQGTPLIEAAHNNDVEIAQLLINHHANLDVVNINSDTALIAAVSMDSMEAVRLLLDSGADLSIKSDEGKTALDWACYHELPEIELMLRQEVPRRERLAAEAAQKRKEIIQGATALTRDLPYKKSPFKLKPKTP